METEPIGFSLGLVALFGNVRPLFVICWRKIVAVAVEALAILPKPIPDNATIIGAQMIATEDWTARN